MIKLQNTAKKSVQDSHCCWARTLHSISSSLSFIFIFQGNKARQHKTHFIPYSLDSPHPIFPNIFPAIFILLFPCDLRGTSDKNHFVSCEVCLENTAGQVPGKQLQKDFISLLPCSCVWICTTVCSAGSSQGFHFLSFLTKNEVLTCLSEVL